MNGEDVPGRKVGLRVREVMTRVLDLTYPPRDIRDDWSLYASAIRLDSLGLLNLLAALEEEFGCSIDDEDVMEADLEDVASLVRLVEAAIAPLTTRAGSAQDDLR